MENTENRTAIDVIVISDDEDSQDSLPLNGYRVEENDSKAPIVILDDIDDTEEARPASGLADAKQTDENCRVSSSVKYGFSPEKFKVSIDGLKKLKATIKLTKLDLGKPLKDRSKSAKVEDAGCDQKRPTATCSSSENRDVKIEPEVKTEKNDESSSGMGIFELVGKTVSPDRENIKTVLANKTSTDSNNFVKKHLQEFTSSNKRSKNTPPSSPSLKQSKLTIESFSPQKRLFEPRPRQEQPVHYSAPLYCKVPLRKSRGKQEGTQSKTFTESQVNTLQALKEENFHKSVLATLSSFMSHHRKPPPSLLFYLLNNILLSKQSSCGAECFRILRQIQLLHPVAAMEFVGQKITWEFVYRVAELSGCTGTLSHTTDSSLQRNASMALSFIVTVMQDEAEKKKYALVKTSAHRLLSEDRRSGNIRDVIQWIGQSLSHHRAEQLDQCCGQEFCPLLLLQRMLLLSLLVSDRPDQCASRIADELFMVYVDLRSIKHKTLLLQSVQSHLLKTKLIEVTVSNCCPAFDDALELEEVSRLRLRQIVFTDFRRSPPANSASIHNSEENLSEDSITDYATRSCEEFIMLLAYWLQSFIFCRKRSLMKNPSSDSLRVLSLDDVDVLKENIDEEVLFLQARLESLCSPSPLSARSYQLLGLMSSLKSFAEMVP